VVSAPLNHPSFVGLILDRSLWGASGIFNSYCAGCRALISVREDCYLGDCFDRVSVNSNLQRHRR
jgi:hypothetical protein